MPDPSRRKELAAEYRRTAIAAGVYRIRNTVTDRALFGSSTNLPGVGNRLAFARSTRSPGALDPRLKADIAEYGIDAFTFEVLEVLDTAPSSTAEEVRVDLRALEALWRERLDPALLY